MRVEQIGGGQFYHGDCFDAMASLPDASVDMVLTDVPYNGVNRKSGGLRNLDKGIADSAVFDIDRLVLEIARITQGSAYVFCGYGQVSFLCDQLNELGFSVRLGAWHKTNPSPMNGEKMWLSGLEPCVFARKPKATFNEHCKSAVWSESTIRYKDHPTPKPIKLFERLLRASSNENDTVLDMFAGSGTTAIAAENCGRKWICIERDDVYYERAVERVRNHKQPQQSIEFGGLTQ